VIFNPQSRRSLANSAGAVLSKRISKTRVRIELARV